MPQYEVQFLSGLKAAYTAIQEKNPYCFYLCTDTNELYIGEELLTNADALAAAGAAFDRIVVHILTP